MRVALVTNCTNRKALAPSVTAIFERLLADTHDALDHRMLDEINDLGPATLENLSAWIWRRLEPTLPGLYKVQVLRDSANESCTDWGREERVA